MRNETTGEIGKPYLDKLKMVSIPDPRRGLTPSAVARSTHGIYRLPAGQAGDDLEPIQATKCQGIHTCRSIWRTISIHSRTFEFARRCG